MRIPQTAFSPPKNRSDCLPPCLSLSFCSDILFAIPPSLSTTNPLEPHVSVTFLPLGLPAFPPARFFGHPHYEQGEGRNRERGARAGARAMVLPPPRRRPHWHPRRMPRSLVHSLPSPICSLALSPLPLWKYESAYFFTLPFLPHSIQSCRGHSPERTVVGAGCECECGVSFDGREEEDERSLLKREQHLVTRALAPS